MKRNVIRRKPVEPKSGADNDSDSRDGGVQSVDRALSAASTDGKTINVEAYRGRIVIVCFFATWSPPSILALDSIKRALAAFPKDRVQFLGVSLDTKPEPLGELLRTKAPDWPVLRDGLGWESPLIRSFGINALPTVWFLDREGKLRALDALENTSGQIRQLLREP